MMSRREMIPLSLLDLNEGQIEGVPRNPRDWTYDDVRRLIISIRDTPELLEKRGLMVFPLDGRYVTIGGNMRLVAQREMGYAEAPCIILPEDTPPEKLRRYVLKDNAAFGEWNYDELEDNWSEFDLVELNIRPMGERAAPEGEEKRSGETAKKIEISVVCNPDEFEQIMGGLRAIDNDRNVALLKLFGYEWA